MNLPRLLLLCCILFTAPVYAVVETYDFSDPALEQRYLDLSQELRCPKCQNQTIADSNAPIAADLRKQLYLQLEAGASDDEIRQYMVDRYGEFVRYRPRFGGMTTMLWLAPGVLLVMAALVAWLSLRRRPGAAGRDSELSDEERQRLQALLGDGDRKE